MATTYVAGTRTGAWGEICRKCFQHNQGIRHGNPQVIITDGAPDASLPIGTLGWDVTNGDGYISTDGAGTWVKINA